MAEFYLRIREELTGDGLDAAGGFRLVDGCRGKALQIYVRLTPHCFRNAVHGLFEALQHPGADFRLEGADCAGHFHCWWYDIEGLAAMDGANTDNGGLQGGHITGNNPLQGADDLCGGQYRVHAKMRGGARARLSLPL